MSFLDDYLAGLRQRQQAYLNQHLGDIPVLGSLLQRAAPGVAAAPLPASAAPFTGAPIGELVHQGDVAAQLLAGGGALAAAHLPAGLTGQDPASAGAVRSAATGAPDPLTAAMAVETLLRRTNPALTTAGEMALNPLNYLPGGAEEALGRAGLRGAAGALRALNEAQAAPFRALGAGIRAAASSPLGRDLLGTVPRQLAAGERALAQPEVAARLRETLADLPLRRAAPEAAAVVRGLLGPGERAAEDVAIPVAGRAAPEGVSIFPPEAQARRAAAQRAARQEVADATATGTIGQSAPPPPTIAAPPRAPFTADLARDMLLDQLGAAPMPAKARLLGALNEANFGGGASNAMRAVTGGADLGALGDLERPFTNYLLQRTIETPAALESLRALHPGLHRAVDLLPDLPERTALDLQNEVRRAAGLPEKTIKPPRAARAAKAEMPAPEAIAPQEAAQAQGGASAGMSPEIGATPAALAPGGNRPQATLGETAPISPPPGGDLGAAQAAFDAAATPEAKLAAERQFVDAYQGAGVAAPAEQVAREGAAEGNRGQDLFAQMRQEAAPVPAVAPAAEAAAPRARRVAPQEVVDARAELKQAEGALNELADRPVTTDEEYLAKGRDEAILRGKYNGARRRLTVAETRWRNGVYDREGGPSAAGGQAPIQLATTLAGTAGGGLAGYTAAGDQASPTDRAAATLAGAAAGGTAGHLGPALLARPGESALRGIAAAGGGPVEAVARGILGGDVAGKVLPFAREGAMAQHVAGSQVEALLPRLRQMGGIWARNVTQTARNALQDETWLQFVLRGLQPGAAGELGAVRRAMADRLNLATEWGRYPTTTTAPLEAAGITDATLNLGQTFHGTEGYLNEVLSNTQNAIGEAGLSALNPVRAAMNPLSVGFAGAKGYARNYQAGLFKAVNQFQQLSARHAVFADEFTTRLARAADRFLPDLERRGYDTTPLRRKLASEGAFSPDDVRTAMMGDNPAVQAWGRMVGAVKDTAEGRARKLLGDYSRRGVIERKAGGVVPFVSWQLRAWPVMAEMIATHPGAALAVGNLLRLSGQQVAANKEPLRNVGTVPIQTPAGTVRLNPLSAVAPGSPEMLSLGNEDPNAPEDRTAYQTASDLLQKVGLGFGPGAQALAYATSQDYKGPGPLSRTAGIENAIGQVPFAQLPSLGAAGLDAARLLLRQPIERVSAPAALPVAGAAQPDYDPNLRRAQEVYYDATGKAIGQPGTAAGAAQTLDPASPLMSRARGDVATSGALRNALSLVLPVGVQAQTPEAGEAQRARANTPFSRAELDRLKEGSPLLSQLAQQRNAQYQAANPVAAIYEANTPTERKLAILHDWDRQHSGLLVDRRIFLARRQQVLDALGLKDNATTRFDIAELAAPAR